MYQVMYSISLEFVVSMKSALGFEWSSNTIC